MIVAGMDLSVPVVWPSTVKRITLDELAADLDTMDAPTDFRSFAITFDPYI